jgi:hypothetical protein
MPPLEPLRPDPGLVPAGTDQAAGFCGAGAGTPPCIVTVSKGTTSRGGWGYPPE